MKQKLNLKDKNLRKKVIVTCIAILNIIAIRVNCPYLDGIIIIMALRSLTALPELLPPKRKR